MKVHLAKANDALATQKKVVVQREIIIPAPVRQSSESTPTAPRIQAAPKVPAKIRAAVALDEPENVQEEPALPVGAQVLESVASEPVASIQQEQADRYVRRNGERRVMARSLQRAVQGNLWQCAGFPHAARHEQPR